MERPDCDRGHDVVASRRLGSPVRLGHPALQSVGTRAVFGALGEHALPPGSGDRPTANTRHRAVATPAKPTPWLQQRAVLDRAARSAGERAPGGGTAKRTQFYASRRGKVTATKPKTNPIGFAQFPFATPAGLETTRGRLRPRMLRGRVSSDSAPGAALAPRLWRLRQGRRHVVGLTFALGRS